MISSSLLARIDPNKKTPRQFSLGMSDWTGSDSEGSDKENHDQRCRDDDDFQQPTRKKHRLDLALKEDSNSPKAGNRINQAGICHQDSSSHQSLKLRRAQLMLF